MTNKREYPLHFIEEITLIKIQNGWLYHDRRGTHFCKDIPEAIRILKELGRKLAKQTTKRKKKATQK